MKSVFIKYRIALLLLLVALLSYFLFPSRGADVFRFTGKNLLNFVVLLAPVFLCVGLLDVWVPRETMMRIMGDRSGFRGVATAYLCGVVTAVPLYALLPVAGVLLKKSCKFSNVMIFLCASASIRIPLLLFEAASLGWVFAFLRFGCNLVFVFLISQLLNRLLTKEEKQKISEQAGSAD